MLQDKIKDEQFLRDRERRNREIISSLHAVKRPRRLVPRHLRKGVYFTKDDLNRLTTTFRKVSWKEASLKEKIRDGLVAPEVLDYFELTEEIASQLD